MATPSFKRSDREAKWVLIDLADKIVGRVATEIATLLRGKNRPIYTPNADTGDFIMAINAAQLRLTGKKPDEKIYYRHSGYMGGLKQRTAKEQMERNPAVVLQRAVKGMLPRNTLSQKMLGKLKIYADANHPHAAQMKE